MYLSAAVVSALHCGCVLCANVSCWTTLLLSVLTQGLCALGCRLAQLVERASHLLRPCSGPGFNSQPGSLCCLSLPLSPCLLSPSSAVLTDLIDSDDSIKPIKKIALEQQPEQHITHIVNHIQLPHVSLTSKKTSTVSMEHGY